MAERGRAPGRTQGYAGTWPPREAARAGRFAPSDFGAWSSLLETVRAWVRAEAGAGRLLPWVPVAFGAGIAFYFSADHEPVAWVTAVAAVAFCAAAFLLRRQKDISHRHVDRRDGGRFRSGDLEDSAGRVES
jgi:competence protein ComEC